MQVNQLAKALNTTPDTVRYYTRIGLLHPEKNENNAYKHYSDADKQRLNFILCARQMGFSVEEVTRILAQADAGNGPCPQIRNIVEQRLTESQERLAQTLNLNQRLANCLAQWRKAPEQAPTGMMLRELIEEF